jgi:glycosyltransferase involved in cell wall biosynthesis
VVLKVLHVVPSLNIGGVEVAISRSFDQLNLSISYEVLSIKGPGALAMPAVSWKDILFRCLYARDLPDVVVSSLWLGHLIGCVLSIVTRAKWVPFFHSARSAGFLRDSVLSSAARMAKMVFFDSDSTRYYYEKLPSEKFKVIPYRFPIQHAIKPTKQERSYDCIFVGRLTPEKRIDLLIDYLEQMQSLRSGFRAVVVLATDINKLDLFKLNLKARKVTANVKFNLDQTEVISLMLNSSLYLSFSDTEGFSMACVDAMSCGCVPVVKPVGEIGLYVNEDCGVIVSGSSSSSIKNAAIRSVELLQNPITLQKYSYRSSQSVTKYDLYNDAFLEGLRIATGST